MTIRVATNDDAVAVAKAHAASWTEGYKELFDPEVIARAVSERCTVEKWAGIIDQGNRAETTLSIAVEQSEVIGILQYGPDAVHPEDGHIERCYVVPSHWGSGIAGELMNRALADLADNGYSTVRLWTPATARSRRFYEKQGFVESGVLREFTLYSSKKIPEWEFIRGGAPGDAAVQES